MKLEINKHFDKWNENAEKYLKSEKEKGVDLSEFDDLPSGEFGRLSWGQHAEFIVFGCFRDIEFYNANPLWMLVKSINLVDSFPEFKSKNNGYVNNDFGAREGDIQVEKFEEHKLIKADVKRGKRVSVNGKTFTSPGASDAGSLDKFNVGVQSHSIYTTDNKNCYYILVPNNMDLYNTEVVCLNAPRGYYNKFIKETPLDKYEDFLAEFNGKYYVTFNKDDKKKLPKGGWMKLFKLEDFIQNIFEAPDKYR